MKKVFDVTVRYGGSVSYTVEAENEEAAKKAAQEEFDGDSINIEANVDSVDYDVTECPDEEPVPEEEEPEQDEGTPPEKPEPEPKEVKPRMTPYERTRAAVYATGNRWAIENFNATHN